MKFSRQTAMFWFQFSIDISREFLLIESVEVFPSNRNVLNFNFSRCNGQDWCRSIAKENPKWYRIRVYQATLMPFSATNALQCKGLQINFYMLEWNFGDLEILIFLGDCLYVWFSLVTSVDDGRSREFPRISYKSVHFQRCCCIA